MKLDHATKQDVPMEHHQDKHEMKDALAPEVPSDFVESLRRELSESRNEQKFDIPLEDNRVQPITEENYFKERLGGEPEVRDSLMEDPSNRYHNIDFKKKEPDVSPPTERPYFPIKF